MKFATAPLIQRHLTEFVEDLDPWSFPYVGRYLICWIEIQSTFTWDSFALYRGGKFPSTQTTCGISFAFLVLSNVHLNSCTPSIP